MHPRRASPVEIRLVVMTVIVALLAVLPALAGAQEVRGERVRLSLGDAVVRALRGSEAVDVAEAGPLRARGDRYRIRLRPILMTTFALIAGMTPIALGTGEGADWRAPLGRAVFGGTITSTFLTLLVVPTAYEILDEWREKARAWVGARTASPSVGLTAEPAMGGD